MGVYIKASDIDSYIGVPLGDFSIPQTKELDRIILSLETRLDAAFKAQGLTVPLTDARDLNLIRQPLVDGLACKGYRIFVPSDEPPGLVYWCSEWDNFIKRAEDGKIKLPSTGTGQEGTSGGIKSIPMVRE